MADANPLQSVAELPITMAMRIRTSTTELLAREFAEAVAAGDFAVAEGWLATADMVARRQSDRTAPLMTRFPQGRSSRARSPR
jgi:hypothetical protein